MTVELHPLDREAPFLESMTIRELIAELARLQDMIDRDAASNGYRPVPGQMHRRAELMRRERRITRELDRRYAAGAASAGT
ncbi:MAG: hypothetical protein HOQ27_00565 [Dermatophilaceae bacterium]|nr:hypothetical protein [Dermatophilaceae bacterium]NUR80097.1 hypothetical protein [Dermatophilaceae bacterium]